jgi:hypothetical protein
MEVLGGADMLSSSSASSLPVVTLDLDEAAESNADQSSPLSVWLRWKILVTLGDAGGGGFGVSLRKKLKMPEKGFAELVLEFWRCCRSEGAGSRYGLAIDLRLARSSSNMALVGGCGTW